VCVCVCVCVCVYIYIYTHTDVGRNEQMNKCTVAVMTGGLTILTVHILLLSIHELQSAPLSGLALLPDSHQNKAGHVVRGHRVSSPEQ
jgi:hypothetical protein